jgi:hypothetical protein
MAIANIINSGVGPNATIGGMITLGFAQIVPDAASLQTIIQSGGRSSTIESGSTARSIKIEAR